MNIEELMKSDTRILADVVGEYTPDFMQIRLAFPYDGGISHLETWQKGTFLHEYVHFLQNISTPFGLYGSLLQYRMMADTFTYLQSLPAGETVSLPVGCPTNQKKIDEHYRYKLFYGRFSISKIPIHVIIPGEKMDLLTKTIKIGLKDYEVVVLNLMLSDGRRHEIVLGGWIIKESMAALCQHMIDPNSNHRGYDIPYNIVRLLCQQQYPALAVDESKLITLCYISLFSMNPGLALMEQLDFAAKNPNMSGEELFIHFVMECNIGHKGKTMSVMEFFDSMIDRFKIILAQAIQTPLDYIGEALDRVKLSSGPPSLAAAFASGVIDDKKMLLLTDYLGLPYMYSEHGWYQYPSSISNPGNASKDVIALIGHHALFNYLQSRDHKCPLSHLDCAVKPECKHTPWQGAQCPVQVMAQALGIDSLKLA